MKGLYCSNTGSRSNFRSTAAPFLPAIPHTRWNRTRRKYGRLWWCFQVHCSAHFLHSPMSTLVRNTNIDNRTLANKNSALLSTPFYRPELNYQANTYLVYGPELNYTITTCSFHPEKNYQTTICSQLTHFYDLVYFHLRG